MLGIKVRTRTIIFGSCLIVNLLVLLWKTKQHNTQKNALKISASEKWKKVSTKKDKNSKEPLKVIAEEKDTEGNMETEEIETDEHEENKRQEENEHGEKGEEEKSRAGRLRNC